MRHLAQHGTRLHLEGVGATSGGVRVKFHLPSVLLGCGAGAGVVLLGKQLHPLALEVATALYRVTGSVVARAAMKQEHIEELLARVRARAHGCD